MKSTSVKRKLVFCGLAAFLFIAAGPRGAAFGAVLESKLTPTPVKAGQRFGNSVSVSGDTAAIEAPLIDAHHAPGQADFGYVFVRSAGTWTAQGRLTLLTSTPGVTAHCTFCHSPHRAGQQQQPLYNSLNFQVALSSDTAIAAGGVKASPAGSWASPGYQVRIFERSVDTWTEKQALDVPNGTVNSTSPIPVAVDGDTIALGTTAAADVYVRTAGTWTVQQSVVPLDMAALTLFGHSLALSGDTMAVAGASSSDNAVYVFVRSGSDWNQEQRISLPPEAALPGTWFPVALSGDTLLIGAPSAGAGSVYVYERSGGTWTLTQTLSASDAATGQAFGFSLAVDGNRAVIGAKTERAAYVFTRSAGNWSEVEKIIPPSGGATMFPDKFPMSLSGYTMLIGASGDSEQAVDSGAAYVYVYPADLSLQKTGNAASVNQNDTVTYTLTVTNNDSTTDATGVTITDTLPAAVSFESASAGCTHVGGAVTCMGTVAGGSSAQASITVRADTPGDITNTASVSADQPDPDMTNNTDSVTIHVNAPPTISEISDQSTMVNMPLTLSFTVGDAETLVSDLTVTATSSDTTLVGVSVGGLGPSRSLTITPAVNQAGKAVISIYVSDEMATTVKSFDVTVENTPPTITPINAQTGFVNTPIDIPFTVDDGETALESLTVTATSSNPTLVPEGNWAFSGTGTDRTLSVTPATDQLGTTEITVSVSDGIDTDSTTFTLTVLNTPSGSNITVNPVQGITVTFSQVTAGGNTTVETSMINPGPVSEGFVFGSVYYDIITTAVLASNPTITVCFSYVDPDPTDPPAEVVWENNQTILHRVWDNINSEWVWTTIDEAHTSRDTGNNIICGAVNSLSWFGIGYDNAPPTFTFNRLKDTLWPPNNRMVRVATVTNVADNTDPSPTVDIRVSSTDVPAGKEKHKKDKHEKGEDDKDGQKHKDREDDDAEHGGNRHARDWKVRKRGGTWEVWVRAERAGKSADRIYTITATVTDRTGNQATDSHIVRVPHDKHKKGTLGKKKRNNRHR